MTTQPENKDKAEQKTSKDELSDKDLANVTGGSVTLNFAKIEVKNTGTNADGTSTTQKTP